MARCCRRRSLWIVLGDTIVALASPPGPSERAVLRISGPAAVACVAAVFAPAPDRARGLVDGTVRVLDGTVAAFALVMPGPGSYTGEDVVELHVPGGPLLVRILQDALLRESAALGLRPARPGEFTRRAFENGRLDLAEAEGVLALIHSGDEAERRRALALLEGGLSRAVAALRERLQDAAAALEAGLDFTEGETGAVGESEWLPVLAAQRDELDRLLAELPAARVGGEVLLLGAANAGKSSLCNALSGRDAVLVDAVPGTTRDVLRVEVGDGVALWDSPGDLAEPGEWDRAAIALRDRLGGEAAAALVVVDPRAVWLPQTHLPVLAVVGTRADLGCRLTESPLPGVPVFAVSAVTGEGVEEVRGFLAARARGGASDVGGPQRTALGACRAALQRAMGAAADGAGAEVVAAEVQAALVELEAIEGRHSAEDLLDRIFARFCLGK